MSATTAQNAVVVVGIDIGKNSFHVVALVDRGAILLRRRTWDCHPQVGPRPNIAIA